MLIFYVGRGSKKDLHLTRPELEKEYMFDNCEPVEVTDADGAYLCQEFHKSFQEVQAPVVKKKGEPAPQIDGNPVVDGSISAQADESEMGLFISKRFPGETVATLGKDEIEAECLKETDGKVNLRKNKSVENMLKDYMKAVK